jgi:hypothetical protein
VHAARVNAAEMVLAGVFYGERPGDGLASALCGAVIRAGDRAQTAEAVTCDKCRALVPAELQIDAAKATERAAKAKGRTMRDAWLEAERLVLGEHDGPLDWPDK